MRKFAAGYIAITRKVSRICGLIGTVAIVFLLLMTVYDVFMRSAFSKPIIGSFEVTEYFMVVIVFLAIPLASMHGMNVRVDLITSRFRKKVRAKLYAASCVLSIFITFILAWYTLPEARYMYELQLRSDMLKIPAYPFYYMVAIGFFILFFVLIANLLEFIDEAVSK